MLKMVVSKPVKNSDETAIVRDRKHCVHCGKREAHAYCTLCHHYFHDNPKYLPNGEAKLIAFPTGKRTADGQPVYGPFVENNCFHLWHGRGRETAWGTALGGSTTRVSNGRANVMVVRPNTMASVSSMSEDEPSVAAGSSTGWSIDAKSSGAESGDVEESTGKVTQSSGGEDSVLEVEGSLEAAARELGGHAC